MNHLRELRDLTGTPQKMLSKLLNVTVHTYIAFEQKRMTLTPEIIVMLSMMYHVDKQMITGELSIDNNTRTQLSMIGGMGEEEKLTFYAERLLGKHIKPTGKNIRSKKKEIEDALFEKSRR